VKKKLFQDININRLDKFLDIHLENESSLPNGVPTFSSIEFSINGACNRRCFFCPRVDENKYPNILDSLNLNTFKKLIEELKQINFNGRMSFSGFCEPLLTKNLYEYVKIIRNNLPNVQIEIVTNGDPILAKNGRERIKKLFESGLNNCRVSLYDGPHQIKQFEDIKKEINLTDDQFMIRKRYLGPEESYGITISNRAGSVSLKNDFFELKPLEEPLKQACYYPFYKVLIDHDGDVLICSNDWKKELPVGNINNESFINIWSGKKFLELRAKLLQSDRNHSPCNVCDVNGMLNGKKSFDKWKSYFSKKS
tara:strand:- start:147 stop:1073 length:927 start_codon:yes stop_codon:yes gene_type:complete